MSSKSRRHFHLSTIFLCASFLFFFFFNDTATTEIYTLSLHDALPISQTGRRRLPGLRGGGADRGLGAGGPLRPRSEEHTSELQSRPHLVCRLLLEKKNSRLRLHAMHFVIFPFRNG